MLRGEHRRRRDSLVKAIRQRLDPGQLRFAIPEGGLYLWCRLPDAAPAASVQQELFRDGIVVVPGAHFYVDRGGSHELRLCFTAHPPDQGLRAAAALARAIGAVERAGAAEPALVAMP